MTKIPGLKHAVLPGFIAIFRIYRPKNGRFLKIYQVFYTLFGYYLLYLQCKPIKPEEMEKPIKLTKEAASAVSDLRTTGGTLSLYQETLGRLFKLVLHQGDEIGMSDFEAVSTIRVIDMIRTDLRALADDPDVRAGKIDHAEGEISPETLPGSDMDSSVIVPDGHEADDNKQE